MIPVNQIIISEINGDCLRACIASLLELSINDIPNFADYGSEEMTVYKDFLNNHGYRYIGFNSNLIGGIRLNVNFHIDGYYIAVVKSRTFENCFHSVIIDNRVKVVHDPNPNKLWQGIILTTETLIGYEMIRKVVNA